MALDHRAAARGVGLDDLRGSGVTNLAPFSFFQMVDPAPPTLMICPQHNGDGSLKDTARNIQETADSWSAWCRSRWWIR